MIFTGNISLEEEEVLLVIVPPDWADQVSLTGSIETQIRETVSGISERRPEAESARWNLRYTASLNGNDLQQLRSVMAGLAGRRVAIPFWPDVQSENWPGRLLAGQYNVGWNPGYTAVQVVQGTPSRDYRGALLVGRVKLPKWAAVTDEAADVQIDFVEDSPWELRAEPRAAAPAGWSEEWILDWTTPPKQSHRSFEESEYFGRGRQAANMGDPVMVWTQQARLDLNDGALAEFLAFWADVRGNWQAFDLPSVLTPGSETPTAPHKFDAANGRMTFSTGQIHLKFYLPTAAEVAVGMEQQLEVSDHSEAASAYAYLYHWQYAGENLRLTDWESSLEVNDHIWTSARIEHERIRHSLKPQEETCEITAYLADIPLVHPLLRMETESPVFVSIYEVQVGSSAAAQLFGGKVIRARGRGQSVQIEAASFRGALRRQIPRVQWSHTCNHTLFSEGCIRRRRTEMDRVLWQSAGQWITQWDDPKVLLENISKGPSLPGSIPAHYWAGGWCEVGSGLQRQVRAVVGSWVVDDEVHLSLARPFRTDEISAGDIVTFWPGCDGRYETCQDRFSNGENFGGMPYIPTYVEQAPRGMPSGGK